MSAKAELGKWYRGKQKVLDEYGDQREVLQSAVAGRGFLNTPGYLALAVTSLEQRSKLQLSTLNYEIVKEAIERELQQTGHDYDIAYKQARIDFELNKTTLLTALSQELADLSYTQALTEEELNRQFAELQIRAIILVTTKAEIKTEMEGLQRELIETDRLTLDREVALAEARLVTASKKLKLIPYLEQLVVKQYSLMSAKEALIPYLEEEIDKKEELIEKEEEIIPLIESKAEKLEDYASALVDEIAVQQERLVVALSKAALQKDEVDNKLAILDADKAVEALRLALVTARAELVALKTTGRISLLGEVTTDIGELAAASTTLMTVLDGYRTAVASTVLADRQTVSTDTLAGDEDANIISVDSQELMVQRVAYYQGEEEKDKAKVAASADITTTLSHILAG